jgi:trimethylamine-N-oxide reductase (cytochrome c)
MATPIADSSVIKTLGFCGVGITANPARVDVKDGRIVRVRPLHYGENYTPEKLREWSYEKDGKVFRPGFKSLLPPFNLSYKHRAYSPNRVPFPMIREDWQPGGDPAKTNTHNRGKSKYQRISWDEATTIIASEIKRIHDQYGPYSVYCQGEGHGETKNYNGSHGCQIMLLEKAGGCTAQARQPDSWEGWYWGAKHIWGMDPVGENSHQQGVFGDITRNGDAILFWGADPETTPWGWGGQQASRMCYWFNEIGVESIFICPDVNYASAVHADKWIPVLPNTDAAFQLAIAYVWITEGLYDKDYIATHADGFDWFEQYVLGNLGDATPKTPQWAEEKCGIKSYRIKAFARYWAKRNVSIAHCNGGGYIRSCFSHEPGRLEVALLGMQAVGKPGRNQFKFIEWTLFNNPNFSPLPVSETFPTTESIYHGWDMTARESFIAKTLLPDAILNPPVSWYGHVLCLYPREDQFLPFTFPMVGSEGLHMIWSDTPCWSTCWNGGNKMQEALRHESIEFLLVQHPWMENDTLMADMILPAATVFECEDLGTDNQNGQYNILYHESRAIEPVGEALSDYQIVVEVAKKLEPYGGQFESIVERYTEGRGLEEALRFGFENSNIPAGDLSFEEFMEQEFWMSPTAEGWQDLRPGLIDFYEHPEAFPLETPTGKLEYYSTALAAHFPDDDLRGPYPKWVEESDEHKERISSERARDYPFLLVSNHPRWRVHANCDDIPWLREIANTCKVKGPDGYLYEPLWVNPQDAARLGLKSGDVAALYNERGNVLGGVYVTERIMPGALYQDHGARIDAITRGQGGLDRGGANNLICPSAITSPNAAGEVTNGFLVGVRKVDVFELAAQYPDEFNRAYDPAYGLVASAYLVDEKDAEAAAQGARLAARGGRG